MKRTLAKSKIVVVLASVAMLFLGYSAQAQTDTWTLNATGLWDTPANWSSNPSLPSTTSIATFGNSAAAESITIGTADLAQGLVFGNSSATTLTGPGSSGANLLSLGSSGITINSGSGAVTIGASGTTGVNIDLTASQTWANNSSTTANINANGGINALVTPTSATGPSTLTFTGTAGFTMRTNFTDSSGGAFSVVVDTNSGIIVEFGTNGQTYSGGTLVESGTLSIQSGLTTASIGSGTLTLGGTGAVGSVTGNSELFVNSGSAANWANNIITLSGGGTTTIFGNGGNDTETFGGTVSLGNTLAMTGASSNTQVYSGVISGAGGISVTTSKVILKNANTYLGTTTVGSGTLVAGNASAFGNASSGAALTLSGGVLDLQTDSSINAYNTTVTANATIDSDKATAASAGITQTLGTLGIGSAALTTAAGTNVSGGTPMVAFGATTLTASATNTSSAFDPTTAGLTVTSVTGSAASTKIDTLELNGSNANNAITGIIADGSGGGTVAISAGFAASTGTWVLSGNNTYSGGTTVNSNIILDLNAQGTSSTNSAIGTGAITLIGGTIDNTSGSPITFGTNNAVTLSGNFTFGGTNSLNFGTGAVTNSGSRTITLNTSNSLLTFGGVMTNTLAGNNTLTVNEGTSTTGASVTFGGYALSSTAATNRADIINGSGNVNITGAVTNGSTATASSLTYSGTGSLALNGDSTYGGGTTVSGGTVYANNATSSTGTGAVSVTSGGTLAGSGTVAPTTTGATAAVTVATGGIIMPGGVQPTPSSSAMANGNLTLNPTNVTGGSPLLSVASSATASTPSLTFTLGAGGAATGENLSGSKIVAGGTGTIANVMNFNVGGTSATSTVISINDLVSSNLTLNQNYVLIEGNDTTFEDNGVALSVSAGTLTSTGMIVGGLSLLTADTPGNFFSQWYGNSELFLVGDNIDVEVIPEPGTWAMMLGGFALLIFVQRRKRKLGD